MARHAAQGGRKHRRVSGSSSQTPMSPAENLAQANYTGPTPQPEYIVETPRPELPKDAHQLYLAANQLTGNNQVEHLAVGREMSDQPRELFFDAPMATHVDPHTGTRQKLLGLIGRHHSTVRSASNEELLTDYTTALAVVFAEVPTPDGQVHSFITMTKPRKTGQDSQTGEERAAWNPQAVVTRGESFKGEWYTATDGSAVTIQYEAVDPQQAWEMPPHLKLSSTDGTVTLMRANRAFAEHNHLDTLGTAWTASPTDLQNYAATPPAQAYYQQ